MNLWAKGFFEAQYLMASDEQNIFGMVSHPVISRR